MFGCPDSSSLAFNEIHFFPNEVKEEKKNRNTRIDMEKSVALVKLKR